MVRKLYISWCENVKYQIQRAVHEMFFKVTLSIRLSLKCTT